MPDLKQLQVGCSLGRSNHEKQVVLFSKFWNGTKNGWSLTAFQPRNASNIGKPTTARVLEQDMIDVSNILKTRFNYDTGPYQGYTLDQTNYKWLAKLDWNINTIHKLSFTYNGLDASKDKPAHPSAIGRRGPDYTTLQFRNSGYEIVNKLNSFNAELKSNFKETMPTSWDWYIRSSRIREILFLLLFPLSTFQSMGQDI